MTANNPIRIMPSGRVTAVGCVRHAAHNNRPGFTRASLAVFGRQEPRQAEAAG